MATRLTKNFTLEEFAVTTHEDLQAANLEEARQHVGKLQVVAEDLQVVRDHFGKPIIVTSGYRGPTLNGLIGGSPTSQHLEAEAVDFRVVGVPLREVWEWIATKSGLAFGQLILESSEECPPDGEPRWGWIHYSVPGDRPPHRCGMIMTKDKTRGYRMVTA